MRVFTVPDTRGPGVQRRQERRDPPIQSGYGAHVTAGRLVVNHVVMWMLLSADGKCSSTADADADADAEQSCAETKV